jgi:hypothetical protein
MVDGTNDGRLAVPMGSNRVLLSWRGAGKHGRRGSGVAELQTHGKGWTRKKGAATAPSRREANLRDVMKTD